MVRPPELRRRGFALALPALLLLAVSCPALAATPRGIPVRTGDLATSAIAPAGDTDTFVIDALAGSKLSVKLAPEERGGFVPTLEILDPSGEPMDLAGREKAGCHGIVVKRLSIPATGRYGITVGAAEGGEGGYRLRVKVSPRTKWTERGLSLPAGGAIDLPVPGAGEFRVRVTVRSEAGAGFAVLSVLDPDGEEVPGAAGRFSRKGRCARGTLGLAGPVGDYAVQIAGGDAATSLDVACSARYGKAGRRRLEISPVEPVLDRLSPTFGTPGSTVDIEGASFADGVAVRFGDALSPDVTRVSATRLLAEVPPGAGEVPVTVENPDGQSGGSRATFDYAGSPAVIRSITPWTGPDTGGTVVDLFGENLTRVKAVRLSGSVLSSGVEIVDAGHLRFTTDSHQPGRAVIDLVDEWDQVTSWPWGFLFYGTTPVIRNPDFEKGADGRVADWIAMPDGTGIVWEAEGTGSDGGRCVSIETSTPRQDLYLMQVVSGLIPGRWYNVTCRIRGEDIVVHDKPAGSGWGGNLAVRDRGRWRSVRGTAYQGTFGWKDVSFTLQAESNSTWLTCRLGTGGNRATGKVWFDELSITEEDFAGSPREGDRVRLVLEAEDVAASGMTDAALGLWIERLDDACRAYRELVGADPYDGEKITIASVRQYPGGWAVAGNPILWEKRYVERTLRRVHEEGDWSFGILHEIGHDYDLDYNWVYNAEVSANLKMAYVLEELDATVVQGGVPYRGAGIRDLYEAAFDKAKAAGEPTSWAGWLYRLLRVKDGIGWEPFHRTYVGFTEKPATRVGRLNRLLDDLSEHSGIDVREDLIPEDELDWVIDQLE